LFDLAFALQESSVGLSLKDIEQKYKVSHRTAERMRDTLLNYFPQMEEVKTGERTKRWRITQRSLNSLISFSAEELAVFKTAIDSLKQSNLKEKADTLAKVEIKLRNILKPEQKNKIEVDADELMKAEGLVLRPGPRIELDKSILNTLRQAILSCHHIKMAYLTKYTGKIHEYKLVPYGFLYGQRDHYLVAKHSDGYDNGKAHNFSLQQIKSVEILPAIFDSSEFDLNAYAQESFGAFHEEPFEVEWLFSANVADEAKNFIFHPKQKLTHNPDGTLTVKFKAGGRREMDWFLYTWGDDVKVIKPKSD
jgi:predicted DNA-binding transcriptional regulator YafY